MWHMFNRHRTDKMEWTDSRPMSNRIKSIYLTTQMKTQYE